MAGSGKLSLHAASPRLPEETLEPDTTGSPSYIEAEDSQLMPPANFAPFFTVVEDTVTGEHYHPSVHYIFADDDQEIITAAAMRELGHDDSNDLPVHDDIMEAALPLLPPSIPGTKERYLIIDASPDGHRIAEIQSLSKEWQVTDVSVRPAPTWDEETESGAGALMLKIGGVEVHQADASARPTGEHILGEARKETSGDLLRALDKLFSKFEKDLDSTTRLLGEVDHTYASTVPRPRTDSLGEA